MSLFEFISGMISVMLALSVAQLLLGVARLVQTRNQVTAFAPHSLWYFNLFLFIFLHWWSLWDFRDLDWNWLMFFYSLGGPTLLFFAATLITPQHHIDEPMDLRQHFMASRRVFLAVVLAALSFISLDGPMFGTEIWFNYLRIVQLSMAALLCLALISGRRAAQMVAALGVLAALSFAAFLRFLPGQMLQT